MAALCKEATTSTTHYGTYQFEVMPLGLVSAPSTSQRSMDAVTQDLFFLRVYTGDVVTIFRSMGEHFHRLQQMFRRIHDQGLNTKLAE